MARRVAIIDGHPDPRPGRFLHALGAAYRLGAEDNGHEVQVIEVGSLDFPLLRRADEFQSGTPPATIRAAQETLRWAEHWVILYPLWLGSMPAVLKGFFEQVLRPGFAFEAASKRGMPKKLLRGKSARIVVTMGMPAFFYRWYYRAHSMKSLERNILAFCGIGPVRASTVGMVEGMSDAARERWLKRMSAFGRSAR